jgi:hypothetical protein
MEIIYGKLLHLLHILEDTSSLFHFLEVLLGFRRRASEVVASERRWIGLDWEFRVKVVHCQLLQLLGVGESKCCLLFLLGGSLLRSGVTREDAPGTSCGIHCHGFLGLEVELSKLEELAVVLKNPEAFVPFLIFWWKQASKDTIRFIQR